MKTQSKQVLKQILSVLLILSLLFSPLGMHIVPVYAAEDSFEKVPFSLNSDMVKDSSIDLYVHNAEHYILIEDLCALTRSTFSVEDDIINIAHGFWRASFDIGQQIFEDNYQNVDVTILEVANNQYAVPAISFLNYFKSMAFIDNGTLYCRMPTYTAWEALNVNYKDSLVDIYQLYGGKFNVTTSLILDILMDIMMGKEHTLDSYIKSAYNDSLDVDVYSYDSVKKYVEQKNDNLYDGLIAKETQAFLESLSACCDMTESGTIIAQEAMEMYILFDCTSQTRKFYNKAFLAFEAGDEVAKNRYIDQIVSVWREGDFQKDFIEKNIDKIDGTMFLLSSAVEAAQQIKYAHQENNLVYRVMGKENQNKLSLTIKENKWFEVPNYYKSTSAALQNSFYTALNKLQDDELKDLFSDAVEQIAKQGKSGIKSWTWKLGLEAGRIGVKCFSWIDNLASDTVFDYAFTDVDAFEADRKALLLSELQSNVYCIVYKELERVLDDSSNVDAYDDYIAAEILYCRASIAMYKNLIESVDEFGTNKNFWINLFQERIDMLAISLYQLTTIQDDGIESCLPLDLMTFRFLPDKSKIVTDAYVGDYTFTGIRYNEKTNQFEDTEITYIFRIPEINLSTDAAKKLNKEIFDKLYPIIEDAMNEMESYGDCYTCDNCSYQWALNSNILSLVISVQGPPDFGGYNMYRVYNIDIFSGVILSNDAVIKEAGISKTEYYTKVKQALGSSYWGTTDPLDTRFENKVFTEFFNEQLNKTISLDNIEQAHPYINKNGQLCIIANQYSMAGSDYYVNEYNLDDFVFVPHYASEAGE